MLTFKEKLFVLIVFIINFNVHALNFKDSLKVRKNLLQMDIGGGGNLAKLSYSRNIFITKKIIIAPRIGFSTLGLEFKLLDKKHLEFVLGSKINLLRYVPFGLPISQKRNFYDRYLDREFTCIICSVTSTNYFGLNYHLGSWYFGINIATHTLLVDRDDA